jgi:hypothetical protein
MDSQGLGLDLLDRLLEDLVQSVSGSVGAGISVSEDDGPAAVAAVGSAWTWDQAQRESRSGPLIDALRTGQAVVADLADHPEIGQQVASGADVPRSVVVLPGAWVDDARMATSLYLSDGVTPDAIEALGRYEPLLAHAHGLLEYCGEAALRADQMVAMMQFRRVIEQAKGMVMSRRAIGADDAFAMLVETSQRENVRLRELATALVEVIGGAPAEQPVDPSARLRPSALAVDAATKLWERVALD